MKGNITHEGHKLRWELLEAKNTKGKAGWRVRVRYSSLGGSRWFETPLSRAQAKREAENIAPGLLEEFGRTIAWDEECANALIAKSPHTRDDREQLLEMFVRYANEIGIQHAPRRLIKWIAQGINLIRAGNKTPFPVIATTEFDWEEVFYLLDIAVLFATEKNVEVLMEKVIRETIKPPNAEFSRIVGLIPEKARKYKRRQPKPLTYSTLRYGRRRHRE